MTCLMSLVILEIELLQASISNAEAIYRKISSKLPEFAMTGTTLYLDGWNCEHAYLRNVDFPAPIAPVITRTIPESTAKLNLAFISSMPGK